MDPVSEPPPDDSATGLPFLRTWSAVYAFVLAIFAVTLGLLTALTLAYP